MAIRFVNIGGGPINNRNYQNEPWGKFFPQGIPSCCNTGLPEAEVWYDPKYVMDFRPSQNEALRCYLDGTPAVAGDKFVLGIVHAGIEAHTFSSENNNGCTGLTYHFEFHDLFSIAAQAKGGAASTADISLPVVNGATQSDSKVDMRDANGDEPYFGSIYGSVTVGGVVTPCKEHKAVVLVIDTIPTEGAAPMMNNGTCVPCSYGRTGCGGGNLACLDITSSAHVFVPNGINHI